MHNSSQIFMGQTWILVCRFSDKRFCFSCRKSCKTRWSFLPPATRTSESSLKSGSTINCKAPSPRFQTFSSDHTPRNLCSTNSFSFQQPSLPRPGRTRSPGRRCSPASWSPTAASSPPSAPWASTTSVRSTQHPILRRPATPQPSSPGGGQSDLSPAPTRRTRRSAAHARPRPHPPSTAAGCC